MNFKRFFYYLLISTLFLASCNQHERTYQPRPSSTPAIDIGDGGLFSGKPCGPPCFYGIRPDITSYQEANKILSSSIFGASCKIYNDTKKSGFQGLYCGGAFEINYINNSNVVYNISFTPSNSITIGEIIKKYGEPSSVSVLTGGYKETTSNMWIYFSQYSMSIAMGETYGDSYLIQSSSIVSRVSYEGKSSYQELTSLLNQKWVGYGKYIMQ